MQEKINHHEAKKRGKKKSKTIFFKVGFSSGGMQQSYKIAKATQPKANHDREPNRDSKSTIDILMKKENICLTYLLIKNYESTVHPFLKTVYVF